jgi:ferredoxin-NADP reductase
MKHQQWQLARVTAVVTETPRAKTFTLELPAWEPHLPGQHYDLRLTAEDGYQAQRSYSVASSPTRAGAIGLTVELIPEGEVSAYLWEAVAPGDQLEVRGPIGGYFVWHDAQRAEPLLLVGGGSGVVPLMAMLRHRAAIGARNPATLLFSVRTAEDAIYHVELTELARQDPQLLVLLTYTRQAPTDWAGYQRRIDRAMLAEVLARFTAPPAGYVCGPTQLVETVANTLLDLGLPADRIRTERFGPSGT